MAQKWIVFSVSVNGLQLFGMILGEFIILHKKPSIVSILASLFIIFGVFLVAKPPIIFQFFDSSGSEHESIDVNYLIGVVIATLSAFMSNIYYILVTKISHVTETFHVACYGILFIICCSILQVQTYGTMFVTCDGDYMVKILTVSFGLAQVSGHFSAVLSTRTSSPVFALIIRLVVIPIGYFAQVFYLDEPLLISSIIGGLIIVASICTQSVYSIYTEARDDKTTVSKQLEEQNETET